MKVGPTPRISGIAMSASPLSLVADGLAHRPSVLSRVTRLL